MPWSRVGGSPSGTKVASKGLPPGDASVTSGEEFAMASSLATASRWPVTWPDPRARPDDDDCVEGLRHKVRFITSLLLWAGAVLLLSILLLLWMGTLVWGPWI
jgi:hypothetical protein